MMEEPANTIQVSMVPKEEVARVWTDVAPHLERVISYTRGRFLLPDVLNMVAMQDYILWIAFDEGGIKGAIVSGFRYYPQLKALELVFVGGNDLRKWKDPMIALLQKWARDNECHKIEFTGRPGWDRMLRSNGAEKHWDSLELPIGTEDVS